jgi:hypothetical protein
MTATHVQSKSRIPMALQSIFLASNRGKEVHVAPPQQIAMKTFTKPSLFHYNKDKDSAVTVSPPTKRPKSGSFVRRMFFGRRGSHTSLSTTQLDGDYSTADLSMAELCPEVSTELGGVRKPRKVSTL